MPVASGSVSTTSAFPPTSPSNRILPACSDCVIASVATKVCIAWLKEPVKFVNPDTDNVVPTNAVDVMLVAPVTTPASTTIVPSSTICCPASGVINKSVPAVELNVFPFRLRLSTCSAVNVPTEVIFV